MNRTRKRRRGPAGSLWTLRNGFITRGGDIERAKRFSPFVDLRGLGTKSLASIGETVVVFSHQAIAVPGNVQLQILEHPSGRALERVISAEPFDGQLYVIAQFDDGTIHHFFDKTRVSSWDAIAKPYASIANVAALLSEQINNDSRYSATRTGNRLTITGPLGEAYSFSKRIDDNSGAGNQNIALSVIQNPARPSGETRATGSFRIADGEKGGAGSEASAVIAFVSQDGASGQLIGLTAGGTELMTGPVSGSAAVAAGLLTDMINAGAHGFSAVRDGPSVTITGPSRSSSLNGEDLIPQFSGNGLSADSSKFRNGSEPFNRILDIRVNGVSQIAEPIVFAETPEETAQRVAAAIAAHPSLPDYETSAGGSRVTMRALPGSGAAPNGYEIDVDTEGDVIIDQIIAFSGGVTNGPSAAQVLQADISGSFDGRDVYVINLGSSEFAASVRASGIGVKAWTYKSKMYCVAGSLLYYSALNNPLQFSDPNQGSGFINVRNQRKGDRDLVAPAEYQSFAAVFSREDAKIFFLDQDDAQNNYVNNVDNTGSIAPDSIVPFGNTDVFYLNDSGIRSLRPRDSSGAAFSEDVGTLIDPFVREILDTLTEEDIEAASGVIEPLDGRYWLSLGDKIMAFSYFPSKSTKVSAWSFLEPGFAIEQMVRVGNQIYVRSGDVIYLYGGQNGDEYPDAGEAPLVVEFPFLNGDNPAAQKIFSSMNADVDNLWRVEAAFDENQSERFQDVAYIDRATFQEDILPLSGRGPSLALRFTCDAAGFASLSEMTIHYETEGAN